MLFLYNLAGYYVLFVVRQYQAKMEMRAYLDKNEIDSPKDLVLKVPLTLPYQMNRIDYEVASGSLTHQGKTYQRVRQMMLRDTLYVYCIEDTKQNALQDELADHTRNNLTENTQIPKSKTAKISFNFLKEYTSLANIHIQRNDILVDVLSFKPVQVHQIFSFHSVLAPPPKA